MAEKQPKLKPPKIIDLMFPIGGLVRQAGFQQQEPYTTFFAQNCWPYDPFLTSAGASPATPGVGGRNRGGSRPGLARGPSLAGGVALGSPSTITLLDVCSIISSSSVTSNILIAVAGGILYYLSGGNMVAATGYQSFNPNIQCGAQIGQYYYVAEFRNPSVAGVDGIMWNKGSGGGGAQIAAGTTGNYIYSSSGFGTINTSLDVIYLAHSPAFITNNPSVTFTTGTVQVQGGVATFSSAGCVPNMVGGTLTITNVESLVVTGYISSTKLAVGDPTLNQTSATANGSWNLEYSFASEASIFSISSYDATNHIITLGTNLLTPGQSAVLTSDNTMTWAIGRMPQVFNPTSSTYTVGSTSIAAGAAGNIPVTYGIPPLNCTCACNYRGRLWLAGPGEVWYASRVLDPTDWDFGASPGDVQRAVSSTTSTTGGLGGPITALIPQSDQYLIISSMDSMWILNGDPAYGGQFQSLSRNIGCIQDDAWTNMPDGSVVFMSKDGIYSLAAGQSYPQPVSAKSCRPTCSTSTPPRTRSRSSTTCGTAASTSIARPMPPARPDFIISSTSQPGRTGRSSSATTITSRSPSSASTRGRPGPRTSWWPAATTATSGSFPTRPTRTILPAAIRRSSRRWPTARSASAAPGLRGSSPRSPRTSTSRRAR